MDEKKDNEKQQGFHLIEKNEKIDRSEFFVNTGKFIIPTLGLIGLGLAFPSRTSAEMSCGKTCSNGCGGSCHLNCLSSCEGFCKNSCGGTCKGGCEGFLRK